MPFSMTCVMFCYYKSQSSYICQLSIFSNPAPFFGVPIRYRLHKTWFHRNMDIQLHLFCTVSVGA